MEFFLSKLNAREFESLSGDIISAHLNLIVEKFKAGKDGGVDGRFWLGKKEGIIQCKHYWKTGYKGLMNKLKKDEVEKVKKLKPLKYIFFTSVPLSRENKKEIYQIFFPFIKSELDVWGEDDINDFLSKKENQNIVEQNYKLWITSTQVLDIIFSSAIKGRSESTLNEIKSNNERYVVTENHIKAIEILKENNVIIISGDPGIGKTTLANNLAMSYIANGYEFCDIEESISEAENLFREKEKKKILFYCDDFLGSNMYDAISNKRDSHIVKFINRVKKDKSKKFILTSRTNILLKAISLSHQFQNHDIREDEFLLKIEKLTKLDKAKILYNHIYHSDIDEIYIEEIYKEKRYKAIVTHNSFNPRIIQFITDNKKVTKVDPKDYWNYIKSHLTNPKDIWRDYFQNQVDDSIRILSFLTVFNGGKIDESVLKNSYSYFKINYKVNTDHTDSSFNAVRKVAIKSLLNRAQLSEELYEYSLFNPSIGDFILNTYLDDEDLILSVLKSLGTASSVEFLQSFRIYKRITDGTLKNIQLELFNSFYESKIEDKDWDYLILLSWMDIFNEKTEGYIRDFIKELSNNTDSAGERLYELLNILIELEELDEIQDFTFLTGFIKDKTLDSDDINKFIKLIEKYEIEDENLIELFTSSVEYYLQEALNDIKHEINFGLYVNSSLNEVDEELHIDHEGIESELNDLLDSIISSDIGDELLDKVCIDYTGILGNIDIESEVEYFIYRQSDDYEEFKGTSTVENNEEDNIDSIFERG